MGCETDNTYLTGLLEDLNSTECEQCGGMLFNYNFTLTFYDENENEIFYFYFWLI